MSFHLLFLSFIWITKQSTLNEENQAIAFCALINSTNIGDNEGKTENQNLNLSTITTSNTQGSLAKQ
jgi:hypothetical protein